MIIVKTAEEIELMRESALVVSKTLGMLAKEIKPGANPLKLDKMAEEFIRSQGAVPGFLGMYDFPNTLNWSPNAQVVHGIPNNEPLKEGDIVSVDCGAVKNSFHGDHAYTFQVGEVAEETKKLLKVTKESLYIGIREFKEGNRVGDVGYAIQKYCEDCGYGVVRELVGHGLGKDLHEDPQILARQEMRCVAVLQGLVDLKDVGHQPGSADLPLVFGAQEAVVQFTKLELENNGHQVQRDHLTLPQAAAHEVHHHGPLSISLDGIRVYRTVEP